MLWSNLVKPGFFIYPGFFNPTFVQYPLDTKDRQKQKYMWQQHRNKLCSSLLKVKMSQGRWRSWTKTKVWLSIITQLVLLCHQQTDHLLLLPLSNCLPIILATLPVSPSAQHHVWSFQNIAQTKLSVAVNIKLLYCWKSLYSSSVRESPRKN